MCLRDARYVPLPICRYLPVPFRTSKASKAQAIPILREVLRSYGKDTFFALVGAEQGAGLVFRCILELPSLAGFLAVRSPVAPVEDLPRILHPTLVAADPGLRLAASRKMAQTLPQATWCELPAGAAGRATASALMKLFEDSRWQGASAEVDSKSRKRPLLTRLAGGVRAWGRPPASKSDFQVAGGGASRPTTARGGGPSRPTTARRGASSSPDATARTLSPAAAPAAAPAATPAAAPAAAAPGGRKAPASTELMAPNAPPPTSKSVKMAVEGGASKASPPISSRKAPATPAGKERSGSTPPARRGGKVNK